LRNNGKRMNSALLIGRLAADNAGDSETPPPQPKKSGAKILIAIIVVVALVVGGAGAYLLTSHPSSTKTTITTTPPPKTVGTGAVKITIWQDFSPTEFPAFLSDIKNFTQLYPNVSVAYVNQTTPSPSTLVSAALVGKAPNIIIGTSDFEGSTLWYHGLIVNMSSYLNSSFLSQYATTALADVTENSSVYALPININGIAMVYNKQLIPTPPQTTNQMIAMAKNITVITNGRYTTAGVAYGLDSDGGYRFIAWQAGFGGRLFASNGTPTLNTAATADAMEFLNNLTTVYNVQPPGLTGTEWQSLFETGHAGIIFDGPWDIEEYINALGAQNVGVAPMPIVSQTGLRPLPFLGSIAAAVLTAKSSGATPAQLNASINFAKYIASGPSELKFWTDAGDFPAVASDLNYVEGLNVSWAKGYAEQFLNYSQIFINTPQMGYYWTPFGTYVSEYLAGKISATSAAQQIQNSIVQSMKQNGIYPYYETTTFAQISTQGYYSMFEAAMAER